MKEHTIHDQNGNLIERTTEEVINNIVYFTKYDGQGNILEEWNIPYVAPIKTEVEILQEKITEQETNLLNQAEIILDLLILTGGA